MKLIKIMFIVLITCSKVVFSQGKIINVPADYPKIQEAVEASKNGDTILVAPGKYVETINFRGKEIVVSSQFFINNNFEFILNTIIDGNARGAGDSASVVTFAKKETKKSILQGFTITGGKGTRTYNNIEGIYFRTGGGILIDRASPTIRYNIITKNESINKEDVSGAGGGGIRAGQSRAIIMNNIITENKGGYAGGVMLAFCSALTFSNNVVSNNSSEGDFGGGSGIYIDWEEVPIINCTITNNYSDFHGGAICITGTGNRIINSIIYGNTSNDAIPVQIFKRRGGDADITYSNISRGYDGVGNINQDPGILDNQFFYLGENSPCIDSGNPDDEYMDPVENSSDKAKFPALGKRTNDMGAYGGPNSKSLSNNITSVKTINQTPRNFHLEQNYPNPFNPNTTLNFSINNNSNTPNKAQYVNLTIYDHLGKVVNEIYSGNLFPNHYSFNFDASNLSSGIYYYTLKVNKFTSTKKMVVIK